MFYLKIKHPEIILCYLVIGLKLSDLSTAKDHKKFDRNSYEYLKPLFFSHSHGDKLRRHMHSRGIHIRNKSDQIPNHVDVIKRADKIDKRSIDEDVGKGINGLMEILKAIQNTVKFREREKFLEFSEKNIEKGLQTYVNDNLNPVKMDLKNQDGSERLSEKLYNVNVVGNSAISINNKSDTRNVRYLNQQKLPSEPIYIDSNGNHITSCSQKLIDYNNVFNNGITSSDVLGLSGFEHSLPIYTVGPLITFITGALSKCREQRQLLKTLTTNMNKRIIRTKHRISTKTPNKTTINKQSSAHCNENSVKISDFVALQNVGNEGLKVIKHDDVLAEHTLDYLTNNTKDAGIKSNENQFNAKLIYKTEDSKNMNKSDRFVENGSQNFSISSEKINVINMNQTLNKPITTGNSSDVKDNQTLNKPIAIGNRSDVKDNQTQNILGNETGTSSGGINEEQPLNRSVIAVGHITDRFFVGITENLTQNRFVNETGTSSGVKMNESIDRPIIIANKIGSNLNYISGVVNQTNYEPLYTTKSKSIFPMTSKFNNNLSHRYMHKYNPFYMFYKKQKQLLSGQTTVIVLNKMAKLERTFNVKDFGNRNMNHDEPNNFLKNITVNITLANQMKINGSINFNFDSDCKPESTVLLPKTTVPYTHSDIDSSKISTSVPQNNDLFSNSCSISTNRTNSTLQTTETDCLNYLSKMTQLYQTTCVNVTNSMLVRQNDNINFTSPMVTTGFHFYNNMFITNPDRVIKQSFMPFNGLINITNIARHGTIRTGLLKQNLRKHKVVSNPKNGKRKSKHSTSIRSTVNDYGDEDVFEDDDFNRPSSSSGITSPAITI